MLLVLMKPPSSSNCEVDEDELPDFNVPQNPFEENNENEEENELRK